MTNTASSRPAGLVIRQSAGVDEYPVLVEIWRSSVRATHDFLEQTHFQEIEGSLASAYLPAVSLIVAERHGVAVGVAGTRDGCLEMLFVAADARGSGVGTELLSEAVQHAGVTTVDVNAQNAGALGFYLSRGFAQIGRSELDGDGRPYPILHLEIAHP